VLLILGISNPLKSILAAQTPRHAWFFVARIFLKTPNQVLRFSPFWGQNQRLFPLLFWTMRHPSILTMNHREDYISQLFIVSLCASINQPQCFCISHFHENFFPPISGDAHHMIVSPPLHNKLRSFITIT